MYGSCPVHTVFFAVPIVFVKLTEVLQSPHTILTREVYNTSRILSV